MANSNEISKEKALNKKDDVQEPVEAGKKAIEADKKINRQNKTAAEQEAEEKKDAEQWRNEG